MDNKFNDKQYEVIRFYDGHAVVLGGSECDKPNILALRVLMAHQIYGVAYEDMLCLSVTTRAQHEIKNKVRVIAGNVTNNLSIFNCQQLCLRFLLDNHIISGDTDIADEEDQNEMLMEIMNFAQLSEDVKKKILDNAINIFIDRHDLSLEFKKEGCTPEYIEEAQKYVQLKEERKLVDHDDIQMLTYATLCSENSQVYKYSSFKWIQVDELHRLNKIQIAIIEKLLVKESGTILYWGDKQESINALVCQRFDTLAALRNDSRVFFVDLSDNYSSTSGLQNMLVNYAIHHIGVNAELLPNASLTIEPDGTLVTIDGKYTNRHIDVVSAVARNLSYQSQELAEKTGGSAETTCILVQSDDEAEELSEQLGLHGIKHIKLPRKDSFMSTNYKVIYSHFSVAVDDTRYSDWIRILYQTRVLATMELTRRFVKKIKEIGLSPLDLMDYDNGSYFINFCDSYIGKEFVVFDIESTGNDFFTDDILRIKAIKMKNGELVPGSEFNVNVSREQEDKEHFMSATEAVECFLAYIGNDELLTHNANSNIHLLENNIKRYTPNIHYAFPVFWDTYRMMRMLNFNMHIMQLPEALRMCGIEVTNLQDGFDNVRAIKALTDFCYQQMSRLTNTQKAFIQHPEVVKIKDRLRADYMPLYKHTADKLYSATTDAEHNIDFEFKYVYNELLNDRYIGTIRMFPYMRNLISNTLLDAENDVYFYQQLVNHLYELRTLKDEDFFQNKALTKNLFIMTVTKAHKMMFDNVIIYNVTLGRKLHYVSGDSDNDARVLYTAISRARKRLYITYEYAITPLISQLPEISPHFHEMSKNKIEAILKLEEIGKRQKHK